MKRIDILFSGLIALMMAIGTTSCDLENPMDSELYIKQISIVGAEYKNEGHSTFKLLCKDDGSSQAFVSVALSGTLRSDKDIVVKLSDQVPDAIDEYNRVYLSPLAVRNRQMPSSFYQIPSYETTIKAGDVYARLPINIRTKDIECDSVYAMPFKIESVSQFDFRRVDTVLIMAFNLINEYSEDYRLDAYRSNVQNDGRLTDSVPMGQILALKAVSEKVVRFFGEGKAQENQNIADHCITITVNSDNTLKIAAWNDSRLTITNGSGAYNPKNKTFYVKWNYMRDGVEYQVGGTLVNQKGQLVN